MLEYEEINPLIKPRASVIWMHGLGSNGFDFMEIVTLMKLPVELGVRFIFPHAPFRDVKLTNSNTRSWFNIFDINFPFVEEDYSGIVESAKLIQQLIEKEINNGIPSSKIIVVGFSQGGAMALHIYINYEKELAAAISLSAWLPLMDRVYQEKNTNNKKNTIFIMHGTIDKLVPIKLAKISNNWLLNNNFNTSFKSYFVGHSICNDQISDLRKHFQYILQ